MATILNNTFEVDTEHHVNWFSATVARSTADFHSGAASLLTTITAQFAGVQLDNYPYYTGVTPGNSYDFSVWLKEATATIGTTSWDVIWYNSGVTAIRTDTILIPRSTSWAQTSATLTAPAGTVTLGWDFQDHGGGTVGAAWYIDDLLVKDAVSVANPTVRDRAVKRRRLR